MARDNKRRNYDLEYKKVRLDVLQARLEKLELDLGIERPEYHDPKDGWVCLSAEKVEETRQELLRELEDALEQRKQEAELEQRKREDEATKMEAQKNRDLQARPGLIGEITPVPGNPQGNRHSASIHDTTLSRYSQPPPLPADPSGSKK